jgi:hypothetical protein
MTKKQKLELTWIGKENRSRLEPRILLEDPEKSYHAKQRVSDKDIFDNRLIFGDNLLALKALEQNVAGKVKCVFIDPPYNTGSAFTHYDDGVEHSIWLSLMRNRLELIRRLLLFPHPHQRPDHKHPPASSASSSASILASSFCSASFGMGHPLAQCATDRC